MNTQFSYFFCPAWGGALYSSFQTPLSHCYRFEHPRSIIAKNLPKTMVSATPIAIFLPKTMVSATPIAILPSPIIPAYPQHPKHKIRFPKPTIQKNTIEYEIFLLFWPDVRGSTL